jgi:hypothetical protein
MRLAFALPGVVSRSRIRTVASVEGAPTRARPPSLHLYEDGTWYCYGACQAGGSIFDFAARVWRMDPKGRGFLKVRARLADEFGITASR